jgi:hypothetical protein
MKGYPWESLIGIQSNDVKKTQWYIREHRWTTQCNEKHKFMVGMGKLAEV